jgi:O-antigen/teichoic acid export membrane protein
MSNIRRQSIISSMVIYFGFAVGMLNTWFFGKEGYFTATQYGLTSIFISIATMMMAFAAIAMPSFIYKFYPYYKDHLPPRKNDMLTWALLICTIGFVLVIVAGIVFKNLIIRKFGEHSPQLLTYYNWIFPLGFGLTLYTIMEAYTQNLGKPILTNFLKEVLWRLFTTVLILLFITGIINNFDLFIKLYAFTFPGIAVVLFAYLVFNRKVYFTFQPSKVSRRLLKKIVAFCLFVYSAGLINTISQVFDSIVIASVLPNGLDKAGIFGLATIMTSVIQVPQRSIISTSIPHLARAWKEKNRELLEKIYHRSSINQLIFSIGIFLMIALNYREAIVVFDLKREFLSGFTAFLLLGLTRVVDMGTGVNAQIIGTSNYWKFELISGIVLLVLMLPLTLILTRQYDILGPAIANLISISIYNIIRIIFLWKKYKLFPFTIQSVYTVLLGAACFMACYFLFRNVAGFGGLVLRSFVFIVIYGASAVYLKLSPDIQPILKTIRNRLRF